MIYVIVSKTEYARQDSHGQIVHCFELDREAGQVFAHGLDQAVAWVKSHPLYAEVEATDLASGRYVYRTEWEAYEPMSMIFEDPERDGIVTHQRCTLTLEPVSTVFETTGYKGGPVQPVLCSYPVRA